MEKLIQIPTSQKLHIIQKPNSTAQTLCETLVGNCTNLVLNNNVKDYSIFDQFEVIVISSISKQNYTTICQYCIKNKIYFLQLDHQDFEEEKFDKETMYKLTSFNLELFRSKSIRSKINFIINNNFEDFKPVDFSNIFKLKYFDLNPKLLFYFYKTIAFKPKNSIDKICSLLVNSNDNELHIIYDQILKLSSYYHLEIILCEKLINYYLSIRYSNHENKKIICSILRFIYLKTDHQIIRKLNFCLKPLICYYTQMDKLGENFSILHELINNFYPDNKNHFIYNILTYSFVHNNESYVDLATKELKEPENNIQQKFYIVLNKVKELQDSIKSFDIEPIHAVEGADQYLYFLLDRNIPKEPSKFFNLLKEK